MDEIENWMDELDPREQAQVKHAIEYARNHASAGAPGHGQFLLIAKLAQMIERRSRREVSTDLLRPAEAKPIDTSRPPDASKHPQGFA